MNKNILTIKNLTKQFAGAKRPSIENINLSLDFGRCLGIVGESGSGKSTLARAIAGLIPVSSGEIYFEDKCIQLLCYPLISKSMSMSSASNPLSSL